MVSKELIIIMASCIGGTLVIAVGMLSASGWETPGIYTGNSNAAHTVTSSTNCYSFQTGCEKSNAVTPTSDLDSGAYLSGDYKQP
jgi:hypothetical protein